MTEGSTQLSAEEVGLLQGGRRSAVTVAVVALALRGAITPGKPGTLQTSGVPSGADGALEKAVHAALHRPLGLRDLMDTPRVQSALEQVQQPLVEGGLWRQRLPHRTRAGRHAVKELMGEVVLPEGPHAAHEVRESGWEAREQLLAVALYGNAGLAAVVPHLAREGGLTGRLRGDSGATPSGGGGGGGIV
ncbi:TIGR04222 domain-containing membrane protein [Streptomyces sp. NBC_01465]|uniref:TIGR04222 domain-containing membrane protein n=1 Tax=Streptomyces sp. NBC_01465 TaxID=2903878 RepID=UPI002E37E2DB|nr:TIGR04222 domain-containing membrane protein [Streptomyces sp. NBC_01465]